MQRTGVHLQYGIGTTEQAGCVLDNPLFDVLDAVEQQGSIRLAAKALGLSYRHVWGRLKGWEQELGEALVDWSQGKPAHLTPFGERLLGAERRARARMAPHLAALRAELQGVLAQALDARPVVMGAGLHGAHADVAIAPFAELAASRHELHLTITAAPARLAQPDAAWVALEGGQLDAVLVSLPPGPVAAAARPGLVALCSHRYRPSSGGEVALWWFALRRQADSAGWLRLQDTLASPSWGRALEALPGCALPARSAA